MTNINTYSKYNKLDIFLAAIPISVTLLINVLGGGFLISSISNNTLGFFIGAVIGLCFEIGVVQAYLKNKNILIKIIVHFFSTVSLVLCTMHVMDNNLVNSEKKQDDLKINYLKYNDINNYVLEFNKYENDLKILNLEILDLKNKTVQNSTLWKLTNNCRNTGKYTKSCDELKYKINNAELLKNKLDYGKYQSNLLQLEDYKRKNPEVLVYNNTMSVSLIERLKNHLMPNISNISWVLLISLILALGLQLIVSNCLKPFAAITIKVNSNLINTNIIEDSSNNNIDEDTSIFKNNIITTTKNKIKFSKLDSIKDDKLKTILTSLCDNYRSGDKITIRECAKLTNRSISYIQRNVKPTLLKLNIWENVIEDGKQITRWV